MALLKGLCHASKVSLVYCRNCAFKNTSKYTSTMKEMTLISRIRSTFRQGAIFLLLLRRFAEAFRLDFVDAAFFTGMQKSLL